MKRWHAFSGLLQRTLSETVEVVSTTWEVFHRNTAEVLFTAATRDEAVAWFTANTRSYNFNLGLRDVEVSTKTPAVSKGTAIVPLTPLPVFTSPGKVLTTRGFWDVVSTASPSGPVSNFAFGMLFLPVSAVYKRTELGDPPSTLYSLQDPIGVPDPLLDDPGFFCYDSFVRVTTDVNQDPPFHSKTQKRFPAHSVLCVVAGVEVAVENLQSLRLDFGIRFRVLIET